MNGEISEKMACCDRKDSDIEKRSHLKILYWIFPGFKLLNSWHFQKVSCYR